MWPLLPLGVSIVLAAARDLVYDTRTTPPRQITIRLGPMGTWSTVFAEEGGVVRGTLDLAIAARGELRAEALALIPAQYDRVVIVKDVGLEDSLHGIGAGAAMYERAHAWAQGMGIPLVSDSSRLRGETSPSASRVWERLGASESDGFLGRNGDVMQSYALLPEAELALSGPRHPASNVPRSPEQEAFLVRRTAETLAAEPEKGGLYHRLLAVGGDHVVLWVQEPDLYAILDRGEIQSGDRALLVDGQPSQCHSNSAALWLSDPERFRLRTGWALSKDGLWRQHSWVDDVDNGHVVETTELRELYYGFRMTDAEAREFAIENDCDVPDQLESSAPPAPGPLRILPLDPEGAILDEDEDTELGDDYAADALFHQAGIRLSSYEELYETAVNAEGETVGASSLGRRDLQWDEGEPHEELSFSVVVDPDERRQGIARALVQSILDAHPSASFSPWVINPHMAALLEDMGFSAEGSGGEWSQDSPHMSYP